MPASAAIAVSGSCRASAASSESSRSDAKTARGATSTAGARSHQVRSSALGWRLPCSTPRRVASRRGRRPAAHGPGRGGRAVHRLPRDGDRLGVARRGALAARVERGQVHGRRHAARRRADEPRRLGRRLPRVPEPARGREGHGDDRVEDELPRPDPRRPRQRRLDARCTRASGRSSSTRSSTTTTGSSSRASRRRRRFC